TRRYERNVAYGNSLADRLLRWTANHAREGRGDRRPRRRGHWRTCRRRGWSSRRRRGDWWRAGLRSWRVGRRSAARSTEYQRLPTAADQSQPGGNRPQPPGHPALATPAGILVERFPGCPSAIDGKGPRNRAV